jgi:uncharacterized membrane-anchored protein
MNEKQFNEHMSKLPALTAIYWIIKITSTTLGETGGDLLSMTMEVGYGLSTFILMSIFFVSAAAQLMVKRHIPWLYWTVILTSSTAGTTMSDWMDRTLGLGYMTGSAILVALLIGILGYWRFLTPHSMSVTNVKDRKIELLYWVAILFSNTLGTALGDYLADDSGLGFAGVAAIIAASLTAILAAYYFTNISRVFLFWVAFVQTRPFGATLGDTFTKSPAQGGLGFGTIGSSAVLIAVTIFGVVWVYMRGYGDDEAAAKGPSSSAKSMAARVVVVVGMLCSVGFVLASRSNGGKIGIELEDDQTYILQPSGKMKVFPDAKADGAAGSLPIHKLEVKRKNKGEEPAGEAKGEAEGEEDEGCWGCSDCICNGDACSCTECTSC